MDLNLRSIVSVFLIDFFPFFPVLLLGLGWHGGFVSFWAPGIPGVAFTRVVRGLLF